MWFCILFVLKRRCGVSYTFDNSWVNNEIEYYLCIRQFYLLKNKIQGCVYQLQPDSYNQVYQG